MFCKTLKTVLIFQEVDEEGGDGEGSAAASSKSEHDIQQQFEKFLERMDRQKPHPSKTVAFTSYTKSPSSPGAATAVSTGSPVLRGTLQVLTILFNNFTHQSH